MKKSTIVGILAAAAVLAGAAGGAAYYVNSLQSRSGFLDRTVINGKNVSGKMPAQVIGLLSEGIDESRISMTEDGKEIFSASLEELGYTLDSEALEASLSQIMDSQKKDIRLVLDGVLNGSSFDAALPFKSDPKAFKAAVSVDALSAPRKKNKNAKILFYEKENKCRIVPEVQGTELEDDKLQEWLRSEVETMLADQGDQDGSPAGNKKEARFNLVCEIPASLYTLPGKKASDKEMKEKCRILNEYTDVTVTYDFGTVTEKLEFKTFMNWLKVQDGKAKIREDKVKKYVKKLIEKYETRYHERVFMTTWGYPVTFSPGWNEYGYTILEDEEIKQLTQDILSGKSVEREPVYLTYNDWGCPLYFSRNGTDDLNGTYVEVNLSAQHMWYYLYGSLVVESDVVTGDVTKDLGTASGVFPLAFKESPSILRGGEGKERYETKVQYWMPFYEGQGLHDANWRSSFGGSIYRGDGSHGCVNLPPWVAEVLYNNIVPGTAIVLYW